MDTATTETYTLSLHDALPISGAVLAAAVSQQVMRGNETRDYRFAQRLRLRPDHQVRCRAHLPDGCLRLDRKSTRLNSSHRTISYAVFCLKKKKKNSRSSAPSA